MKPEQVNKSRITPAGSVVRRFSTSAALSSLLLFHHFATTSVRSQEDDPPVVSLALNSQFALEGYTLNSGLVTLSRTGSTERSLPVRFEVAGTAVREDDYWLELAPCGYCLRPSIHITGNEVTIPANLQSITIGFNANFEFNPPAGFTEPVLENIILRILPPEPDPDPDLDGLAYVLGDPSEAEIFVVDQDEDSVPSLTLIAPSEGTVFSEGTGIPIKLLSVEAPGE